MAQRDRSTVTTADSGWRRRFNETVAFGQVMDYSAAITDFVDPGDCKVLSITKKEHLGGRINKTGTGNLTAIFNNYLADRYRSDINGGSLASHNTLAQDLGDVHYATSAAARTSPSRPYVDVPVNLLELGDITRLLRTRGLEAMNKHGRKLNAATWAPRGKLLGRTYLEYQFAVAPLVGDLIKLLDFQDQVERRVQELERLRNGRGLRRTIKLGDVAELTGSGSGSETVQSAGGLTISSNPWTSTTICKVGAHVRWKPAVNLSGLSPGQMRLLARKAVLGQTLDFKTVWEVIPWSWLIDWGTNIGQYLAAQRNIVPATLVHVSVMRQTRTVRTWNSRSGSDWTLTKFVTSRETKTRNNSTIAPVAHWPFLSANQMGILASLFVTRAG